MSQAVIKRLRAALAGSRGISIELPKAFVVEVLEAMEAGPPTVDLDALVRKQREWNEQVITEYLRSQSPRRENRVGEAAWVSRTACTECDANMIVLGTRKNGRRLLCIGCSRRVTVKTAQQPERA